MTVLEQSNKDLLTLADFLEKKVQDENFDLSEWKCGSVCCAVGWAGQIEVFNVRGFKLNSQGRPDLGYPHPRWFSSDWQAVDVLFNLKRGESYNLFNKTAYRSPVTKADVIQRIRDFVKARGAS
jgi:hypothetical protein